MEDFMPRILTSTPKEDGFRMPAEFEPHQQTWMLWPERPDTWRLGAKPAQRVFAEVAKTISQFESVSIGVSAAQFQNARIQLPENIRVIEISYNDSWMRDCGPIFVKNDRGEVRVVNWKFNAWGGLFDGLYFPWDMDEQIPEKIAEIERMDRYDAPMVLEGGAFNVDGEGTLLTTEECLLSPGRNPDLTKGEIERYLSDFLNIQKVIWLGKGLDPDETNGHVDGLCCFVRPGEVLLHWTEEPDVPHYEIVQDAYERLSNERDARGRKLEIHKLHGGSPIRLTKEESEVADLVKGTKPRREEDELDSSYINFYISNGGIVVPAFGDEKDKLAVETLSRVFPDRKVVSVPGAREISLGGGNIHCITQQQPSSGE
jgi:agmatine deiminase